MGNQRRRWPPNKRNLKGLNSNDFISRMPDDIIIMVLSRLSVKEAVVTSILSTRWRFLWCNLQTLNFDARQALDNIDNDFRFYLSERYKYTKQVNGVIRSYNHPTLHHFRIRFYLTCEYTSVIDEWLKFAVKKKVESLELDLETNQKNYLHNTFNYSFPSRLSDKSTSIFPSANLESLKKLYLNSVNMRESVLGELLTKSPHLESISIHGSGYLTHIHVGGRDLKLKHFEIVECPHVVSVYLSDFGIESFTYVGQPIDLHLSGLPNLKNVVMSQGLAGLSNTLFGQILSCASTLQTLSFKIYHPLKIAKLYSIRQLPNIRKLTLTIVVRRDNCLLDFASLVNVFPNIQTFTIELLCFSLMGRRRKATYSAAAHHHDHLKLFQILGYYGGNGDLELAAYMLQNANALEKIVIDPRAQLDKAIKATKDFSENNEEAARSSARLRLPPLLPQGVELVIL
ncbi:putative F-box domain, FBD domain, leucine-rich repeat domain superfamily [Helianthus annuus]|nr:putative F-box protein At3g44060 [Helianthus annuus]KAJ0934336.1 putative F-box domain, FBD domain, leucine-rich repeat domain superfamily [Helianthus annuus]